MTLGYLIGSIVNSIWITKFLGINDVRKMGSKNAGATNVKRIHGKLIGLIVFILDICKPVLAMGITSIVISYQEVIVQAVGVATVMGHIFPIFHKFKGGKGAACMLGYMITVNWTLFFIGAIIFLAIVIPTKKVSLGSLIAPFIIMLIYSVLSNINGYNSIIFEPITYNYPHWFNIIGLVIIIMLVVFAHQENIKRILHNNENLL